MWLLQCSDPDFKPARVWLAPGTEHVIGRKRSKPTAILNDRFIGINSKAVSRKHAVLIVGSVERDSSSDLVQKHSLSIADCSKHGTSVDGKQVQNQPPTPVTQDTQIVQLGSCEHQITISWKPVCMALTHISRTKKSYNTDFAAIKSLLEPSGIKLTPDFNAEHTTHLVASKRNVAATLTGLVHGCFIVSADFIDLVGKAVTTANRAGEKDSRAPLEEDFDDSWPDALQFVPPAGKEPVPRGSEFYAPDPQRQKVFQGYTFVMCLPPQMDNLQGPITQGGGKAVLYGEFEVGITKPEDFVIFVKKVTGVAAPGELRNNGPGPVVVRITGDDEWAQQFVQRTDLLLGQRSILQNEFLDPILLNDASFMRQPLQEEDEPSSAPTQSNGGIVLSTAPEAGEKLSARARRLKFSRVKSRFKGFDDFEATPLSDIPLLPSVQEDVIMQDPKHADFNSEDSVPLNGQASIKKRGIGQAGLEEIQPTAAEVKRRRIQAGIEDDSQSRKTVPQPVAAAIKQKPKLFERRVIKKGALLSQDPEMAGGDIDKDLRNAVRAQADLEEQQMQAQREAELLEQPLTAEELDEIKNRIQYEVMEVRQPRTANGQQTRMGENWDDSWNGRKNFKKFRRKGQSREQQPLRSNRVVIPLDLAEENSNPLGAVRWATVSKHKRQNGKSRRMAFEDISTVEDDSGHHRPSTLAETERHLALLDVMSDNDADEAVNKDLGDMPSRGLLGVGNDENDSDGRSTNLTHITVTQATSSVGTNKGKKRATTSSMSKAGPPAKRVASTRFTARDDDDDSSDSSEDELRFKFSSRAKKR